MLYDSQKIKVRTVLAGILFLSLLAGCRNDDRANDTDKKTGPSGDKIPEQEMKRDTNAIHADTADTPTRYYYEPRSK